MKQKVIIGLSGGVDSAVSAYLLQKQGYAVEGLFMKNWEQDDNNEHCPAAQDLADAESVCKQLNIKVHTANFAKEYWENVFTHFLDEYAKSRTPNPDILCNKEIKFKVFFKFAMDLGADFIATGHYAKIRYKDKIPGLYKAKDRNKDQTYFLHAIDKQVLNKTIFPLGNYLKSEVRVIAEELGLANYAKKDSTGICFIGERRFKTFLNEYMLAKPGEIVSVTGESIGKHDGLMFYTLGQRQGLNIGGSKNSDGSPWYVVDKNIENNCLIVAQGKNHPMLYAQGLICGEIHWLIDENNIDMPLTCLAKTRYRQEDQACVISPSDNQQHCIMFSEPQRAITPGQYIVFYDKNQCLGGAVIEQIIR